MKKRTEKKLSKKLAAIAVRDNGLEADDCFRNYTFLATGKEMKAALFASSKFSIQKQEEIIGDFITNFSSSIEENVFSSMKKMRAFYKSLRNRRLYSLNTWNAFIYRT